MADENTSVQTQENTQTTEKKRLSAADKAAIEAEEREAERKAREAFLNELVPIKFFKDNNKYKDDVYVSVNGENCVIQRGKQVMIKRKFAQVLENSLSQDEFAADMMAELSQQYEQKKEHLS